MGSGIALPKQSPVVHYEALQVVAAQPGFNEAHSHMLAHAQLLHVDAVLRMLVIPQTSRLVELQRRAADFKLCPGCAIRTPTIAQIAVAFTCLPQ